ncbi:hypothetical protein HU200_037866 [Digitaria exilis]|uniref:Uncharacterized protein n=1 Tax=Digitaria exilis TaxID=1010633 RepID=A0A835BDK3_9POAL|nr:hypothetical protein HU200_037866 [Digitaria exilis]
MARALPSSGGAAAAAAGLVQPWLAVLGVALLSVWAITLAVLLCGDSGSGSSGSKSDGDDRPALPRSAL